MLYPLVPDPQHCPGGIDPNMWGILGGLQRYPNTARQLWLPGPFVGGSRHMSHDSYRSLLGYPQLIHHTTPSSSFLFLTHPFIVNKPLFTTIFFIKC